MVIVALGMGVAAAGSAQAEPSPNPPAPAAPAPAAPAAVGTYSLTLPLIFQGAYQGDVPVSATPDGHISVDMARFVDLLGRRLSPELITRLTAAAAGRAFAPIELFEPVGVIVAYNPATLELNVSVPVSRQGAQTISAVDSVNLGLPSSQTIPPSRFSASLSLLARQSYDWGPGSERGLEPLRVATDVAANFFGPNGVYLFAQGDYDQSGLAPYRRGNIVLIHDDQKRALRYLAGDVAVTSAGFQGSPTLAGIGIERAYGEIQPFNNIRPSGQYRFVLERPSTIDVVVNGAVIRTIQLDAGQYNLKDFPFFDGLNEVQLYAVDGFGRRLLTSFSQFYTATLLNQGVSEFGATVGAPQILGGPGGLAYDARLATFSGYARYGLTKDLTVGANLQFNRRQSLTGLEIGWGSPIGAIGVNAAFSTYQGLGTGHSIEISYQLTAQQFGPFQRPQLNLDAVETSAFFSPVDAPTPTGLRLPNNPFKLLVSGRFSSQLPYGFGFGVFGSWGRGRGTQADETRYAANLSHRIGFADLTVSLERVDTVGPQRETRLLLTLNIPLGPNQNVRASYDTRNREALMEYTRFQRDELGDVGLRASLLHNDSGVTGAGELSYNGNRFSALLQHTVITGLNGRTIQSQQTTYTLGTQLAYAGGLFAIGRPVGPRFAIVAAHETLAGSSVGARQGAGRDRRQSETGALGPALVEAGNAYTPSTILVDVRNLPTGYDIGPGQYDTFPGPASGYAITVGSDASRIILGTLLGADGKPVALQGGEIRSLDRPAAKPILVFTNSGGRFVATGLAPGRYRMLLGPALDIAVTLTVPASARGLVDVGVVHVDR